MRAGSLFSGIGGLDYGLHRAEVEVVFQVEADDYRRAVLRERFPGTPVYSDVREITREELDGRRGPLEGERGSADAGCSPPEQHPRSSIDLLCGGFPCQDLSVAGQRKGFQGERSSLYYEFLRIATELRPRWILLENVVGLLSSHGGEDFATILRTMGEAGYGLGWRVLDTQYFPGVPQRRRRVFIVGCLGGRAGAERAAEVLAVGESSPWDRQALRQAAQTAARGAEAGAGDSGVADVAEVGFVPEVAKPLMNPGGGLRTTDIDGTTYIPEVARTIACYDGVRVRRLTPRECERLQGLPDDWTLIDDYNGKPASDTRRYAAVGDAVSAPVAEWIGRRLVAAHNAS